MTVKIQIPHKPTKDGRIRDADGLAAKPKPHDTVYAGEERYKVTSVIKTVIGTDTAFTLVYAIPYPLSNYWDGCVVE